jgi:outer membrane protein assembly factor BamB
MTTPSGPRPTSATTRPRPRALAAVLAMLAAVATLVVPAGAAGAAPEPGQYVPVTPVTVVDNLSLAGGGTTTATVTNVGGVPPAAGVAAVAVNVIANQPSGTGHLTLSPAGAARPVDSTLNYQAGRTVAGFEVVRTSASGQISIFSAAATRVIVRVRGYYTSATSTVTGTRFVPVAPATVVNDVALAAGGTTTFTATGSTGANGIPASPNVKALAVNVIANQPAGSGHLTLYPVGTSRPVDSTLNYQAGRTTAGFEVVRVPADGRIAIFTPTATRVIVRVRGYYTSSPYTDEGGTFTAVPPATLVDNLSLPAGGSTTVTVAGASGVPGPAQVSAVALNVIANQPTGSGHLTLYPAGPVRPVDSTLNYQAGRTTAGHEVVPVPADGRITIFTPTATRVVVRLRGWYAPAPGPSGADWVQDRNGPTHPGTNTAEPVLTPATVGGLGQAWSAAIGETRGGAAVVDDLVYVNSSGRVRALDAATGVIIWTGAVAGAIESAPAVAGGVLYVGSADGRLFALDAATGAPRWNARVGFSAVTAPAVAGGAVYAGSADGRLAAVDAASGAVRWTATIGGSVRDAPAVAGGAVFVRTYAGNAHAFDAASGAARWTTAVGGNPMFSMGPSPATPTVADGVVYVAGPHNGRLYALEAATGAVVWDVTAGASVRAVALADGVLHTTWTVGAGTTLLRALDPATGATRWTVGGAANVNIAVVAPVIANGVHYSATVAGALLARDPATGAVLWSDTAAIGRSTSFPTALVVANGAVFVSRLSGVTAHHP